MGKQHMTIMLIGCLLAVANGCAVFQQTPPGPEILRIDEAARVMPQPVKNRVHVLFVHGYDPFDLADLADLRQHAVGLGYIKTYAGSPFHVPALFDAAQEARARQPESRFVLVSHGSGCSSLANLATRLRDEGMPVDAVLCLAPGSATLPTGMHVVAIVGPGKEAPEATQTHVLDAGALDLPTHPRTRAVLSSLLTASAQQVALLEEKRGPVFPVASGEWGFLGCQAHPCQRNLPIVAAREMLPGAIAESSLTMPQEPVH